MSKSNQLSDIDAAVKATQGLQEDIGSQTADLEKRLLAPVPPALPAQSSTFSPTLKSYVEQQSQLHSRIEQESAEQDQLQKTRDLDRSTYELLRSRLAEQNVNGMISDLVAIGSASDEEQTASSRSALRSLVLDTGLWVSIALVLGIGLAFLLSVVRPDFNSNAAITRRFKVSRGGPKARVSSEPQ